MELGIENRLALVTGASRGIGRAIAASLADEGARVVLVGRTQETLNSTRAQLSGGAERHHVIAADLMTHEGLSHVIGAFDRIGFPDIAVHNLGGSLGITKTYATAEEWQRVWTFNVGIAHELNRQLLPQMVAKRWGRVVHLSTLSSFTYTGYAPYVSAKCALNGYVKTVSSEVSKDNVIISAVAPGAIYLEGRYFARIMKEDPAALERYFGNYLPIRRLGTAQEIGPVVALLCSDHASFMAGSIVGIDGGGKE